MNVEEYRKGEATLVAHCPARAYCPLGHVCATVAPGGSAPLFPVISEVRQGELVWLDLRYEQRALVIRSGQFECFSHFGGDREVPFALFGSGYGMGLSELYLSREIASSYYLRALGTGRVCSFSAKALRHRLEALPAGMLGRVMSVTLTNISSAAYTQQRITARNPLSDRIALVLLRLHDLTRREGYVPGAFSLTHGEIAELAVADRVATTRALHRMEEEGLVELGYRSVRPTEALLAREDLVGEALTVFHAPDVQRASPAAAVPAAS